MRSAECGVGSGKGEGWSGERGWREVRMAEWEEGGKKGKPGRQVEGGTGRHGNVDAKSGIRRDASMRAALESHPRSNGIRDPV